MTDINPETGQRYILQRYHTGKCFAKKDLNSSLKKENPPVTITLSNVNKLSQIRTTGWGCKHLCSLVNVPFHFPNMPLYSQNCWEFTLYFPELPFYFPGVPFYFMELVFYFPEVFFISWNCPFVSQKCLCIPQKCPIVFQNLPLIFQTCLLFIYCTYLFSRIFFPADCTFAAFYSELLREITFALPSLCFLLELFIDQHPRRQSHVQS